MSTSLRRLIVLFSLVGWAVSCALPPKPPPLPEGLQSPFTGYRSAKYADPSMWLCLPGRSDDPCHRDLTATDLHPDGTRTIEPFVPAPHPDVDCFYIYPTVDLGIIPGNHDDFHDIEPMAKATIAQAARFQEACSLYVPLYRQATIGAYFASDKREERHLEIAAADVMEAFLHYMGQYNHGRKIILLGHSQGGEMVVRLLKQFFDDDPLMRERLLLALPIGVHLDVASGSLVGGTFHNLQPCTQRDEVGCLVGYRSYVEGVEVSPGQFAPGAGDTSVCVNPAAVETGGPAHFSRAYLPTSGESHSGVDAPSDVTTPFILLRDFYEGRCVDGPGGDRHLAVSAAPRAGDSRKSPIELSAHTWHHDLGLHILDYQFAQGDLIDMVARRAKRVSGQ